MISDICQITNREISWFFYYTRCPSVGVTSKYPKKLRIFYLFHECCISRLFTEIDDIRCIIEIISRDYDKVSIDLSIECQYSSTSSWLLSLFNIVYFFSLIAITKVCTKTFFFILHYEINIFK